MTQPPYAQFEPPPNEPPNQPQHKKPKTVPIKKSTLRILIAMCIGALIALAVAMCNAPRVQPTDQPIDPQPQSQPRGIGIAEQPIVGGSVGDTLDYDGVMYRVDALEKYTDKVLGTKLVCTTVYIQNTSDEQIPFNMLDWSLQNPAGVVESASFITRPGRADLRSGDLAPGGLAAGQVCFQSDGAKGEYIVKQGLPFSSQAAVQWKQTL